MQVLNATAPDFAASFERLVHARRESGNDVTRDVADIIAKVRAQGDKALAELSIRFDGHIEAVSHIGRPSADLVVLVIVHQTPLHLYAHSELVVADVPPVTGIEVGVGNRPVEGRNQAHRPHALVLLFVPGRGLDAEEHFHDGPWAAHCYVEYPLETGLQQVCKIARG